MKAMVFDWKARNQGRSCWIPGSYAAIWSKALNSILRPLKNKGFEEERMTQIGWHTFVNSTTLEFNKSHRRRARPAGVSSLASLGVALGGPAKRGQEHDALARSVRREERRYLVVVEG